MLTKDEAAALQDLSESLKDVKSELRGGRAGTNRANISINASGAGVWLAMLFVQSVMLAAIVILFVKFDRAQDYLNAIYMQAPHLKPPTDEAKP